MSNRLYITQYSKYLFSYDATTKQENLLIAYDFFCLINSVTILNTSNMLSCISVIILLFPEINRLKFITDEENAIFKITLFIGQLIFFFFTARQSSKEQKELDKPLVFCSESAKNGLLLVTCFYFCGLIFLTK